MIRLGRGGEGAVRQYQGQRTFAVNATRGRVLRSGSAPSFCGMAWCRLCCDRGEVTRAIMLEVSLYLLHDYGSVLLRDGVEPVVLRPPASQR